MRISPISYNYALTASQNNNRKIVKQNQPSNNPCFKGDLGRFLGSVAGIGAAAVAVSALAVLSITPAAPAILAGVAAKAFGDAGDKLENDMNK